MSFLATCLTAVYCQTGCAADDGHYYATQVGDFGINLSDGDIFHDWQLVLNQFHCSHYNWIQLLHMKEISGVKVQAVIVTCS